MRLRHIEVFHAVMQAGTVSGAAHLLHVSQPAVSKVLRHCKQQLGMPLFERVRGKFHPTPEARRLFTEVDKLNRDLLSIRRLADNLRRGEAEAVRLVTTPTLGQSVIPVAMTRWVKSSPQARCQLATNHTREIVNALLLGDADLALTLHDPQHPSLQVELLAEGQMMALLPRGHAAARAPNPSTPLPLQDLMLDLIGLPTDDPLGGRLLAVCDSLGLHPQVRLTVQTYQLARALVEAGVGPSVVDPFTAACADPRTTRTRPLASVIPVQLLLLTSQQAPLSQAARRLVQHLRDAATESLGQKAAA